MAKDECDCVSDCKKRYYKKVLKITHKIEIGNKFRVLRYWMFSYEVRRLFMHLGCHSKKHKNVRFFSCKIVQFLLIKTLDPDPELDPGDSKTNADPQHCLDHITET
jgi:hypothetical protein